MSISSNIVEGAAKPSDADFARFLDIALGSAYEVETQLLISMNIGYIKDDIYGSLLEDILSIEKQLTTLIRYIRKNSKTFGQYVKIELSEENRNMVFIPEGFAHGFVALSDDVEIFYKASGEYVPQVDKGILWNNAW